MGAAYRFSDLWKQHTGFDLWEQHTGFDLWEQHTSFDLWEQHTGFDPTKFWQIKIPNSGWLCGLHVNIYSNKTIK